MTAALFLTSKVRLHCDCTASWQYLPSPRPFPDLKGQAPLRLDYETDHGITRVPFPDLKGQAPLRLAALADGQQDPQPFPDLKGQAPLRRCDVRLSVWRDRILFLTSKVRLHCDGLCGGSALPLRLLFLTSKVRLHCDRVVGRPVARCQLPFPDLKGQAPLRQAARQAEWRPDTEPFPDLKGQAPLRPVIPPERPALTTSFS